MARSFRVVVEAFSLDNGRGCWYDGTDQGMPWLVSAQPVWGVVVLVGPVLLRHGRVFSCARCPLTCTGVARKTAKWAKSATIFEDFRKCAGP